MIEDLGSLTEDVSIEGELAVVGAGPAGIVTALEAASHGISVVLIESGQLQFDADAQRLSEAAHWDPERHAPVPMVVGRQVGGTSVIWGGRCVPYDPVDFESRPFVSSASWPITYDEISGYFQRACDWLVCGRPLFHASQMPHLAGGLVPGLVDGDITSSSLERWSLPTNFGAEYLGRLRASPHIRLVTGVTGTEFLCPTETKRAKHLECRTRSGKRVRVTAKAFVVACGGLETTRLLMSSGGPGGGQLGNDSGHLGRWYMAHAEGVTARVHFSTPPRRTVYGCERDVDGVYVRRRLGFSQEFQVARELPNIVGWLTVPELSDARHQSGRLSLTYLAFDSPLGPRLLPDALRLPLTGQRMPGAPYGGAVTSSRGSHVRNILREPLSTGRYAVGFVARQLLARGPKAPGAAIFRKENVYPLQFHGEHLPNRTSFVSLSREVDDLGRPKLNIALRFSDADVDGVVRAHHYWDRYLRSLGVGWLEYGHSDTRGAIERRLGGGFHQLGTTRMSAAPASGVVDRNLAVHGVGNVYVASSSTFVTSSQAHPTFMIVALAVRLADRLRSQLRPAHHPTEALGRGVAGDWSDAQPHLPGERRPGLPEPRPAQPRP